MRLLQLVARLWAALSIGFVLFMFFTQLPDDGRLPAGRELIPFALFPVGVCLGLVLAFWRARLGGAIAVLSLLAFYLLDYFATGALPKGPWLALVAAPGLLFLCCQDRPRAAAQQA